MMILKRLRAHFIQNAPTLLKIPLGIIPFSLQSQLVEQLLSWQFQQTLKEGELDFLTDRWLKIEVIDLALTWFITVTQGKLMIKKHANADVSFSGNTNDLILIAARKQDPDTLFFQRRLHIEGDTELGLHLKNLLDSIELESMPTPLRLGLLWLADMIETSSLETAPEHNISSPC